MKHRDDAGYVLHEKSRQYLFGHCLHFLSELLCKTVSDIPTLALSKSGPGSNRNELQQKLFTVLQVPLS